MHFLIINCNPHPPLCRKRTCSNTRKQAAEIPGLQFATRTTGYTGHQPLFLSQIRGTFVVKRYGYGKDQKCSFRPRRGPRRSGFRPLHGGIPQSRHEPRGGAHQPLLPCRDDRTPRTRRHLVPRSLRRDAQSLRHSGGHRRRHRTAYGAFLTEIPVEKLRQIDALREKGIRTYVLSNNNPASMEYIRQMFTATARRWRTISTSCTSPTNCMN